MAWETVVEIIGHIRGKRDDEEEAEQKEREGDVEVVDGRPFDA